jgi:signal transduction histidine kinase
MSSVDVADLRRITLFADLADDELAWIAERSEQVRLEPGGALFEPGAPAEYMYMMLEGTVEARRLLAPADQPAFRFSQGEISGMIPFSRMTTFAGTGRAVTTARVARLHKKHFPDLLHRIPALEPRLVGLLTDRVRETTQRDQQYEKLVSLGKVAAGLAHELNNPAAAVRRAASDLRSRLDAVGRLTTALIASGIDETGMRALNELRSKAAQRAAPAELLDAITRTDREEALSERLRKAGVSEPWVAAATFVDGGVDASDLEAALALVPEQARCTALEWLEGEVAADSLLSGVEHASTRVAELIGAIKIFSHMDRAQEKEPVDVRANLENTLTLFTHRIREKRIVLDRSYAPDVPQVIAYPGELNQVWANLVANAIDAVSTGGHIGLHLRADGEWIVVEVRDNGSGIPPEIRERIWEPFFTTKDPGQGTGLGLDIIRRIVVRRHGGEIDVESTPGDTRFIVKLPLTTGR